MSGNYGLCELCKGWRLVPYRTRSEQLKADLEALAATEHSYLETTPAACASGVVCKKCKEEAVKLTFSPDGTSSGVCACPWTSWLWTAAGKACRSEPA